MKKICAWLLILALLNHVYQGVIPLLAVSEAGEDSRLVLPDKQGEVLLPGVLLSGGNALIWGKIEYF